MRIELRPVAVRDRRGVILDIVERQPFEYATFITMRKGAVRANHYHKETIQWAYVLKGRLKVFARKGRGPVRCAVVGPRHLVRHATNEQHAFLALTDSELLILTRGPRGGRNYEQDTFRLPPDQQLHLLADRKDRPCRAKR